MTLDIYSQLYWLTRLDGIIDTAIVITFLGLLAIIITFVCESDYLSEEGDKLVKKIRKLSVIAACICVPIIIFVPTKNDMVFIIATGKTINFAQTDSSIQKIPAQTTKLVTDILQAQIEKLK